MVDWNRRSSSVSATLARASAGCLTGQKPQGREGADAMASRRTTRIARNQAMFRMVNERVSAWPEREAVSADEPTMRYCECADTHCFERVYVTRAEYEAIRADSTRFAVVVGHV